MRQVKGEDCKEKFTYLLVYILCAAVVVDYAYSAASVATYSEALVVYPDARNVRFNQVKGTDQVVYEVAVDYPADGVISWTSNKLKEMQWQPLEYDVLNPGLRSSHVVGWQRFIDATKDVEYEVHHWLADWKNASGSVVRYEFKYRYPRNEKPQLANLEVSAVYIPASWLKQVQ